MKTKPVAVQQAIFAEDLTTLSRMGKAGGRATARKRGREKELRAIKATELKADMAKNAEEANEHICPVEP